jgi:hypothetical protein
MSTYFYIVVKTIDLDVLKYPIYACWVAIPALYSSIVDFDDPNMEPGIHVHARKVANEPKSIDDTFDIVNIVLGNQSIELTLSNCVAYLLANMVDNTLTCLTCPKCQHPHIDEAEYALIPHQVHTCKNCHHIFVSPKKVVSSIIPNLQQILNCSMSSPIPQTSKLVLSSNQYSGGVAILACGPAIIWSSSLQEEDGVHVHAYKKNKLSVDTTVGFAQLDDLKWNSVSTKFEIIKQLLSLIQDKT